MRRERRGFVARRARPPLGLGSPYGFLRPPRRQEEETRRFLDRVRSEPELRREMRASLALQLVVVGLLGLALVALVVQSLGLVGALRPYARPLAWMVPAIAGLLALAVLRRFLRLWSDYRRLRD